MEIGTWNGNHAEQMIRCALKYNKPIEYYGFDLFEKITDSEIEIEKSKSIKSSFKEVNSKLSKLNNTIINLCVGYTKDTIPSLKTKPFDFIFVDGGHSLPTIQTDWNNLQRFIVPNKTLTILDDYWIDDYTAGCAKLVSFLSLSSQWDIALLDPIDSFPGKNIRMVRIIKKY